MECEATPVLFATLSLFFYHGYEAQHLLETAWWRSVQLRPSTLNVTLIARVIDLGAN